MTTPRLTKLELQVMEALWTGGQLAIREIHDRFPAKGRQAYTTIQTTVYRLEEKGAVRRAKKISNAHIFEATLSREQARGRLIDDLLDLFGDRLQPVMSHLIDTGRLTRRDIQEAEQMLDQRAKGARR